MQTIAGSPLLARLERDSALVLRSSSLQGASANRNRSFRITSEDSGVSIFWSCYGSWTHWAEILLGYLAKSWQQNAKTEGYLKILRAIAHFDMFWIEIDTYSAEALGYIRRQSAHPISSCETLFGLREFMPYFREQAMDVAIIDTVWNGVWQSMKIAALAEAHEVNVAPHNFYGHLCTMMNAHFAAAVPNLRIMEIDIDRLAWDDELVTHSPQIEAGHLIVPDRPGWGTEPNEDALAAHPPKPYGGLDFRKKS